MWQLHSIPSTINEKLPWNPNLAFPCKSVNFVSIQMLEQWSNIKLSLLLRWFAIWNDLQVKAYDLVSQSITLGICFNNCLICMKCNHSSSSAVSYLIKEEIFNVQPIHCLTRCNEFVYTFAFVGALHQIKIQTQLTKQHNVMYWQETKVNDSERVFCGT